MKVSKFEEYSSEKLVETFEFSDVVSACEFMKKCFDLFNELDHHPDYFCLDGKKVTIKTITHSEGRVTDKDLDLVDKMKTLS